MSGTHWTIPFAARKESHSTQVLTCTDANADTHMGSSHIITTCKPRLKPQPSDSRKRKRPRPRRSSLARMRARLLPLLGAASRRPSLFARMPLAAPQSRVVGTRMRRNSTRRLAAFGLCSRLFYIIQYLLHFYAITQRFVLFCTSRAIEELSAHGQHAHKFDKTGLVLGNHARARSASAAGASGAFQCPY